MNAIANTTAKTRIGALQGAAQRVAPGLLVAVTIAAAARFMSEHYGAPAMLFALPHSTAPMRPPK